MTNSGILAAIAATAVQMTTLGVAAPAKERDMIEITRDGTAMMEIVVPVKADPVEQHAALELQNYLRRISGTTLALVSEAQATDRARIFVGRTQAAGPTQAELHKEDHDAFAVRPVGRDLVLVGASGRSTLYAVYDFLERDLGCRWLAPGSAWEEVPERKNVKLSVTDRIERPGMKYRFERMTLLSPPEGRENDCLVWAVRQKINTGYEFPAPATREKFAQLGGFRAYMWPHSMAHMTDMEKLCREHPEWFALVKGKRQMGSSPLHTNLCTTDPQVIDFLTRMLADAFDALPDVEVLPLGPGDGVDFCECERCAALDAGGTWSHSDGVVRPALADRWLTCVNTVADRIAKTHPGKKIYTLSYHQTFSPPIRVKPAPNVMIMVVNSRPEGVCFVHQVNRPDCPNNSLFRRNFEGWQAITPGGMLAYQYMPHSSFCTMPLPAPHKFVSDLRWLSGKGCVGYEAQSGFKTFGLYGITLYTVAKAMWNPSIDADALLKDYCDSAFHESSEPMVRFFGELERGQRESEHTSTGIWGALTPDVLTRAREQMNAALSKVKQDKVKCRLACLDAHFRYAEQGCVAYRLASEAAAEKNGDKLAEAERIARQATGATEAVRSPDASCIDVEIIPASLDRILKQARDAMRASAKSRPSRIDQDHRN